MHISLNNEWILIIQTPLFSGKIEFLTDVKIFEKSLDFKNGLLYLLVVIQIMDRCFGREEMKSASYNYIVADLNLSLRMTFIYCPLKFNILN